MTNEEILSVTVLNSWKLVINRFNKTLSELSDEQLQQQVAPGKNRVFYLLGHLTAITAFRRPHSAVECFESMVVRRCSTHEDLILCMIAEYQIDALCRPVSPVG